MTTQKTHGRDALLLLAFGAVCAAAAATFRFAAPGADDALVRILNPDGRSALDGVLKFVDAIGPTILQGSGLLLFALIFALPRFTSGRRTAAAWILGFAWAQTTTNVLKATIRRERPVERADLVELFRVILPAPDVERSFPSGHVTTATVVAAGFWLVLGALGVGGRTRHLLAVVPLVMMWDRVGLGHHYPSDVCAGAAVALLCVGCAAFAVAWIGARRGLRATAATTYGPMRRYGAPLALCALIALGVSFLSDSGSVRGVDPISGESPAEAAAGRFTTQAPWTRLATEPFVGPALRAARVDRLRELAFYGAAGWGLVLGIATLLRVLRGPGSWGVAAYLAALLPAVWTLQFAAGSATPDRFRAEDGRGVFVDWHLHGGDRVDGRQTIRRTASRQKARGVTWAVTTRHTNRPEADAELAHGVFGTEWSGADYPRTQTAHVLVLGSAAAVDAANAAATELDAVRAAKERGALVIVAHYWRTAARLDVPSLEAFRAAGVDGFEVGNRYPDSGERLRRAAAEVDAFCRKHGLLRVSFSDDHGWPVGSPCVTWLDGVTEADLAGGGAKKILSQLRRDAPAAERIAVERVVPLRFDGHGPSWRAAASWFAWLAALIFLARRVPGAAPS